jgi:hypothetical protein
VGNLTLRATEILRNSKECPYMAVIVCMSLQQKRLFVDSESLVLVETCDSGIYIALIGLENTHQGTGITSIDWFDSPDVFRDQAGCH